MAVLSDHIEQFIKSMMDDYEGMLEIQRNELAEYFNCAPSQINYVLTTRFSPEKGYIIESRRGGGGFIRLIRMDLTEKETLYSLVKERLDTGVISQRDAVGLIDGLHEQEVINESVARVMKAAVSDKALTIPAAVKDHVRASVLQAMLCELFRGGR